jgi:hypothetical protein
MTVFCDALVVTSPPDSPLVPAVDSLLDGLEGSRLDLGGGKRAFRSTSGALLHITQGKRFSRVDAGGQFLGVLRAVGLFRDYLSALSEAPHRVTRLDAALDQPLDAAPVLSQLWKRHRGGYAFTRKAVSLTRLQQTRFDGAETGTVYFGKRGSSQVLLRAYDKQHEAYEERGEILPPTLRWELECAREVGASLRDADDPAPLFYRFMSPDFLPCPPGVPAWSACDGGWALKRVEPRLPAERLRLMVGQSADIARLLELADECGPEGRTYLLGLLRKQLFPEGAKLAA